ncbi:response regulator [Chitiniphilus purpureus]|uniref:histidine kinase n=1 Tax=Chitiniphilus purpureus TaxID=2981137 RepID=A0ABY6DLZ1_9NEIS|nr:response regulator [Chitiniphilus sp. CD1]UXY15382.1 response regulator [Chitiniphilus sp. CD1]
MRKPALPQPIALLLIEDDARDAELLLVELERAGYLIDWVLVAGEVDLCAALARRDFDLILSDFLLPGFSGEQALHIALEMVPEVPFIFVSGVSGEEHAVNMMREGATDYVLKQSLKLLPKAVERALLIANERTERRRMANALRTSELNTRLAVEAAQLGMWDYEPQSGTLTWDRRCRAMFGVEPDAEVTLETFRSAIHPDDLPRIDALVAEAISQDNRKAYIAEYRIVTPGGALHWVVTRGQAFFEQGRCVHFTGVLQDITERKQADQAMHDMNAELERRVEERTRERDRTWQLSRDLLVVARHDTQVVAVNPAWLDTLGWRDEDLLGRQLVDFVHPEDYAATLEEAARLASGQVTSRFENRFRHADGSYHWLSWAAVPEGELVYGAGRDITLQKVALHELAYANRALLAQIEERERVEATLQQMQRLEAVGQLTAGVAHDFNNLLTVVLSNVSFLGRGIGKGVDTDKLLQYVARIREAGERGAKLTGQLLSFSRRQRLAPQVLDLNATIQGMLDLLRSTLGGSVLIEIELAGQPWLALVDPTQVELIVLNLAINARDAMRSGGTLRLSTANETLNQPPLRPEEPEPGEYVVLSVGDSGSGMTPEVMAKAFEPFFTTKEPGKGSGLGLAQVYGFAKQSGGGVRIHSRLGEGTTVSVYLPRASGEVQRPEAESPGTGPVTARTVLLVDDDAAVREATSTQLAQLGYQVLEADSGEAALTLLEQHSTVELLLADFAMPGMNGGELARRVRAQWPGFPILFLSGYADLQRADLTGIDVVQKPFHEAELVRRIERTLQARPVAHQEGPQ